MARPLRIEYEGAVHHVMSRGNARASIVADDEDRKAWVAVLGHVAERFQWRVWAYCLMDNHFHVLVETPNANLSRGMRELNGVYTQAFNRRHGRVGHLLQGRFKALVVEKEVQRGHPQCAVDERAKPMTRGAESETGELLRKS
jgi:putative transposase